MVYFWEFLLQSLAQSLVTNSQTDGQVCCPSKTSGFFVCSNSWKAGSISALENTHSWFTSPNQDLIPLMFVGAGNSRMVIFMVGFYAIHCYPKSHELHFIFCKMERIWIEDDTIVAAMGDVIHNVPNEACINSSQSRLLSMQQVFQTILTVISLNWQVYSSPDAWKPCGTQQYQHPPHSVSSISCGRSKE